MSNNCSGEFEVINRLGLHARPASMFVQVASRFDSEITVCRVDSPESEANGKSLISMLILAAAQGTKLCVKASGPDAGDALKELGDLISRGFDEE